MNEASLLQNFLVIGGVLFALGLVGFLVRRNAIIMFLCAEMMLQGVSITLVAFSRFHNNLDGQMLVLFIIAVAACEAAIALALILMLYQRSGTLDIAFWQSLREDNLKPHVDRRIPAEEAKERVWPSLTPSGVIPEADVDELSHRRRV
ncbi:MAG: NADH-quinone oxidoreductase subunit NuoK [Planctomycetes bacterium]|nr:NADH-quinone oxidoreductase subunit NuoK [Planctomycetota bacterium]